MDPRQTIQSFVEAMTSLMALMRNEIDLVKARQYEELPKLQGKKAQLAKVYEINQAKFQADPAIVNARSTDEKGDLRQLFKAFRETLSDNMLALRAAHDAADRVVKLIIRAVKKQRGMEDGRQGYGRPSKGGYPMRQAPRPVVSFALNQET